MVLIHHALYSGVPKTPGQNILRHITGQWWIGVDLFFVLSGFLITGILLDVRTPTHALRNFYLRRFLRITPVYVAFLLFCLLIAPRLGVLTVAESVQLHESQTWYWLYAVNILIALKSWSAVSFALSHLWSLAVEEQFYLLWPLAVLTLKPTSVRRAAVGCIVVAELFRGVVILSGAGGQVNYVLLPSRMDSLAAGAFLACSFRDPLLWQRVLNARRSIVIAASGVLIAIIAYRHTIANQAPLEQLIAFPAIVALATVVIATAVRNTGWLTNPALRFIGKISYGMYVWHVVAVRAITNALPPAAAESAMRLWLDYAIQAVATVGMSAIVAAISWYAIEQPILRLKRFVPYNS